MVHTSTTHQREDASMSATPSTWEQWYRTAAATVVHTLRARMERASASAILGAEQWTLTPAGGAALPAAPRTAKVSGTCPWCGRAIRRGDAVTVLGGLPLHNTPCLDEYDAAVREASGTGRAG